MRKGHEKSDGWKNEEEKNTDLDMPLSRTGEAVDNKAEDLRERQVRRVLAAGGRLLVAEVDLFTSGSSPSHREFGFERRECVRVRSGQVCG
jgi:hypothetical protein